MRLSRVAWLHVYPTRGQTETESSSFMNMLGLEVVNSFPFTKVPRHLSCAHFLNQFKGMASFKHLNDTGR